MKTAIYFFASVQALILVILFLNAGGSDAAGNAMEQGFLMFAAVVMIICLLPAVLLARANRAMGLALALTAAPLLLILILGSVM